MFRKIKNKNFKTRRFFLFVTLCLITIFSLGCDDDEEGSTDLSSLGGVITVEIASTKEDGVSEAPIPILLTFSQAVTGLELSDFEVTGATINNLNPVADSGDKQYRANLFPADFGEVEVFLPAKAAQGTGDGKEDSTRSNTFTIHYGTTEEQESNRFGISFSTENNADYYFYQCGDDGDCSASFSKPCSIDPDADPQDINCMVDVNEGDIFVPSYDIDYRVPTEMCSYLRVQNWAYYNYEVGTGPSEIHIHTTEEPGQSNTYEVNHETPDVGSLGLEESTSPSGFTELTHLDPATGDATCIYDHSNSDGPNCCFGSYTLTIIRTTGEEQDQEVTDDDGNPVTDDDGNPVTTTVTVYNPSTPTVTTESWGGNLEECLAGPAAQSSWPKGPDGLPINAVIYPVNTGSDSDSEDGTSALQDTISVPSSLKTYGAYTNYSVTNFYKNFGIASTSTMNRVERNGNPHQSFSPWFL